MSQPTRYNGLAIALHWIMAFAIFGMLAGGLLMTSDILSRADGFAVYQIHKSLGVLLLWAITIRIIIRITTKTPALPDAMHTTEKRLAKIGHGLLYLFMIIMPVTGWVLVSASSTGIPTIVFDMFQWPHIPGIAANKPVRHLAGEIHEYTAFIGMALIAAHILATAKHRIKDHINLLPRMGIGKINTSHRVKK